MSVQIPTDLYNRIVEALPYGEERDDLIALTTVSNSERSVTLRVPESLSAHFAYALQLGGTTARMCGGHPDTVQALYDAGDEIHALMPEGLSIFLHHSDKEKILDLLVHGDAVAKVKKDWRSHEVVFVRDGRPERSFMTKGREEVSADRAQQIADELNAFAERCRAARPVVTLSETPDFD